MGQADPVLTRLGAGPAVKKLVETAIGLSNSQDPAQRNLAYGFMESAIRELEDDGIQNKILEEHDDDDEHKIHEADLKNNNTGERTTGSEQSTENKAPYSGEGKDTANGEKPMQDMDGTENQFGEMAPGMMQPGMGMPPQAPGLDPNIAQEMGQQMPPMPQMNNNQMMRQAQYTVQQEIKKIMGPIIKKLETQIRETKLNNGTMKLDVDSLKNNASATFRETIPSPTTGESFVLAAQQVPGQKRHELVNARSEIEQMDKMINSQKNPMYS